MALHLPIAAACAAGAGVITAGVSLAKGKDIGDAIADGFKTGGKVGVAVVTLGLVDTDSGIDFSHGSDGGIDVAFDPDHSCTG